MGGNRPKGPIGRGRGRRHVSASDLNGAEPDPAHPQVDPRVAEARSFVTRTLGSHSSHPYTLPHRLSFWRWVSVAAGTAVLAYSAYAVYRAFSWEISPLGGALSGLRKAIRSTDLILFVLALSLSATLTAALTIRVSTVGAETSHRPFSRLAFGASAVVMSLLLFGQCILFAWLVTTNSIEAIAASRWWVVVAAAIPLEAILLFVEIRERRSEESSLGLVWAAARQLLFAASVAAFAVITMPSLASSIGGGVGGWLKSPTGIFGSLLSFVPGADALAGIGGKVVEKRLGGFISSVLGLGIAMMVVAWVTAKVSRVATFAPDNEAEPAVAPRRGCIAAVLRALNPFAWFRGEGGAADGQEQSPGTRPPRWLKDLPRALAHTVSGRVEVGFVPAAIPSAAASSQDYAPESRASSLEILFGGRSPTVDQVAALELFEELWLRHAHALHAEGFGRAVESHADLLMQAFPESFADPDDAGVLEVQVAAAIVAVVSRGQRVVFMVADEGERARVLEMVESRLVTLRIETLYRAGSLAPFDMGRWAPPAAAPGTAMEERPPDVMVGTLGDYEQALYGGASASHVVRAILFDAEVLMVPNLLTLTRAKEGRLHLPFMLDKHRLMLASENRTVQVMIGTPPIGERPAAGRGSSRDGDGTEPEVHVALESIALRLFGGDASLRGHTCNLRRRAKAFPGRAIVRVTAGELGPALRHVALHIAGLEGPAKVCLVLGREDPRPAGNQTDAMRSGDGQVEVLHELDFADTAALAARVSEFAYAVMQSRTGGRLIRDVGARVDPRATVLVEVTSAPPVSAMVPPRWTLTLPVFPSADSPALALAHLRSGAYQLGRDSCMRRDDFVRFGIGWNRARWIASGEYQVLHEGWSIELDGSASTTLGASTDQGEIWPAAIVRSDVRKERPVSLGVPPERGLGLAGSDVLQLAEDGFAPDPDRAACWVGPRGQILGKVDLAYASRFVFGGDRQEYRAASAERSEEHGWIIHGQPFHGHADEPELPAVEISLDIPPEGIGTSLQVRQGEHLRIVSVRDRGGASRIMSTQRIAGLASRSHRLAARRGALTPGDIAAIGPMEYRLRVGVSFVCLGSAEWLGSIEPPATGDALDTKLPDWMSGSWVIGQQQSAGRTFSPAFTVALQQALSAISPGVLDFSRVAAFRLGEGQDGVAIAFIEPHATVGTVAEVMRTIMDDPALRRRLIGKMLEAIVAEELEQLPDAPLFLVRMDDDEFAGDRLWAQRIITRIPGSVIDVGGPIGVIARDREADLESRPAFTPSPVEASGNAPTATRRWLWQHEDGEVELSVEVGVSEAEANAATAAFGCSPSERDPQRLRQCGVRMYEAGFIGADYSWMIERSVPALEPLAARLADLAIQAGASTVRDRIEVFASFVQSLKYVRGAEGRISDGKLRLGVQMPQETLFTGSGDCDSLTVLLLALVRAAKLAPGCIALVDDVDSGHSFAAFEVEPRSRRDWAIRARSRDRDGVRTFTVIETTAAGWRLGTIAPEYRGRYVRLDALG